MRFLSHLLTVFLTAALSSVIVILLLSGQIPFFKDKISVNQKSPLDSIIPSVVKKSESSIVYIHSKNTSGGKDGVGTGFVFNYNGKPYILTNEHVIHGADDNTVLLNNSKFANVNVVGTDYDSDVAILSFKNDSDAKGFTSIPLGDSSKSVIGESVIAIGYPQNIGMTVTTGIISAKNKSIQIQSRSYEDLLQIDAPINPGNSGGPLIDMEGNVIGINTALMEDSQGIGFALSIDNVKKIIEPLVSKGFIQRPFIGVSVEDTNNEIKISDILKDSPASKAGLQVGDAISKIDGNSLESAESFAKYIKSKKVGEKISVTIKRGLSEKSIDVVIGNKKDFVNEIND